MRNIVTKLELLTQRDSGQTMAEYAVVLAVIADRHLRRARRSSPAPSRARSTRSRTRSRPRENRGPLARVFFLPRSREAPDRRLSHFLSRAYSRDAGELHLTLPQPARRRGARAHGRRDPGRGRGRPASAGAGRDGDRAARAPAAGRGVPRALQRAARLHRAARRSPASRSSATTSTTTSAACRPRTACSTLYDPRTGVPLAVIDAAGLTDMRTGAVTRARCASPRAPRTRACSATSARAARPTGTCACSPTCSSSTRSASTRAGPRAARPSAHDSSAISVVRCASATTGSRSFAAPTSWSRRRGSSEPEPLLRTEWIEPGALVVPYGTMSAVELSLTDIMDKLVVDDWGQCRSGPFGVAARARRGRQALGADALRRARRDRGGRASRGASATTRRSCSGTAA